MNSGGDNLGTKAENRRKMILGGNLAKTLTVIILPLAIYQLFNSTYTLLDQIICAQKYLLYNTNRDYQLIYFTGLALLP